MIRERYWIWKENDFVFVFIWDLLSSLGQKLRYSMYSGNFRALWHEINESWHSNVDWYETSKVAIYGTLRRPKLKLAPTTLSIDIHAALHGPREQILHLRYRRLLREMKFSASYPGKLPALDLDWTLLRTSNLKVNTFPWFLFDELFHGQTDQYISTVHSTKFYQVFFVLDRSCGTFFDIFHDCCIAYASQTASVSSSSA